MTAALAKSSFVRGTMLRAEYGAAPILLYNHNLIPPGYYMLFLLSDKGIPSVAKIVRVGSGSSSSSFNRATLNRSNSERQNTTLTSLKIRVA